MSTSNYIRIRSYLIERYADKTEWYALLAIILMGISPWFSHGVRETFKEWVVSGLVLYIILVFIIILFVLSLQFSIIESLVDKRLTRKYAQRYRNQFKLSI